MAGGYPDAMMFLPACVLYSDVSISFLIFSKNQFSCFFCDLFPQQYGQRWCLNSSRIQSS